MYTNKHILFSKINIEHFVIHTKLKLYTFSFYAYGYIYQIYTHSHAYGRHLFLHFFS